MSQGTPLSDHPLHLLLGPTHRLVVFDAAVRAGSFSAAAEALDVSQPAVSRQIAILERQLQCVLFRRERNRVTLTQWGVELHESVSAAFPLLESGVLRLRGHDEELTLAVQPAVADSWFSSRLNELHEAVAPTTIRLVLFDLDDELESLDHDVSVRFSGSGSARRGFRSRKLVEESVTPFASPSYAQQLGLTAESTPTDLADGPALLRMERRDRPWLTWDEWFTRTDVTWNAPKEQVLHRSYAMLLQQALGGRGVVLGWHTLMGDLVAKGLLIPVGPTVSRSEFGYNLVWPAGLARSTGLRRLTDWMAETIGGLEQDSNR